MSKLTKIISYPLLYHVAFWAACFYILFRIFTQDFYSGAIDFMYVSLFIVPMIVVVYINRRLLNFSLSSKRLILYIIGVIGLVLLSILLHRLMYDYVTDIVFHGFFISSYFTNWEIAQYTLAFIGVSSLLKLAKDWFVIKERELVLTKENHRVQLSSLQSQINPHFLLNSLNNIYSLSSNNAGPEREYILKLSDALRYMIYETGEDKVLLQDELSYLSDYIELEKLRMENASKVAFSFPDDTSELIAPLILLPLVENCFKHVNRKNPIIQIEVQLNDNNLSMITKNTYIEGVKKETYGGLGLKNLKSRLELLYKGKYTVQENREEGFYITQLNINLVP